MELKDFIGEYTLDAVDYDSFGVNYDYNEINGIIIRLNGTSYTFIEDPEDGYRSMLNDVFIESNYDHKTIFPGIDVVCSYETKCPYEKYNTPDEESELIVFRSKLTGKIICIIGTDYNDSYYPSFVSVFQPENMDCNLLN